MFECMRWLASMFQLTISGAALGLALRPETRHFLLALLALGITIRIVSQRRSLISAALGNAVSGIATACVSGSWARQALRSLGSDEFESLLGFGLAAIACAGPTSLLIGMMLRATKGLATSTRLTAIAASVFVIEHAFSRLPGFVPWIFWGYAAAEDSGLAQLASVGGVPLVSATLAAGAWALAEMLDSQASARGKRIPVAVLCGVLSTSVWGLSAAKHIEGTPAADPNRLHIIAVQPGLPQAERLRPRLQTLNEERLARYSRSVLRGQHVAPALLVWPEGAILSEVDVDADRDPKAALARGARLAERLETPLILGLSRRPTDLPGSIGWNLAAAYGRDGELLGTFHKRAGVPIVESRAGSAAARIAAGWIGAAGSGTKIEESAHLAPLAGARGSVVLLCYEILLPWVVEGRRPREATVVLNLADDSWDETRIATRQLAALARFRAIEQRLPLIRLTQGGGSASFDAFGEPLASLSPDRYGAIEFEVAATSRTRLPVRARLLLLPLGSGGLAWWILPILWRRARVAESSRLILPSTL